MLGRSVSRSGEQRILTIGMMWLLAAILIYIVARLGNGWYLRSLVHWNALPARLDPFDGPFLTFAHTVALSLLTVWMLKLSRNGAFVVCAGWWLVEAAFEFGELGAFSSRVSPLLPDFMRHSWLWARGEELFARGTFDAQSLTAAALGAGFAYLVVANSIPRKSG